MKPMVSDEILRAAVIKELADDPELVAKHIAVVAIDGAVTLGGHVMTIHEKHVAVRAAERAEAVRAVADEIEVREPSLHERADDEIAEEIAHLRGSGTEIPDSVAAQIREGRVILHGEVDSVSQREAAESAVRQLTGVRVVDMHLSGHVPSSAALQIALNAAKTAPGVTAVDSEIVVTGPDA